MVQKHLDIHLKKKEERKICSHLLFIFYWVIWLLWITFQCSIHILGVSHLLGKCLAKWPLLGSVFPFIFLTCLSKGRSFAFQVWWSTLWNFLLYDLFFVCVLRIFAKHTVAGYSSTFLLVVLLVQLT